MMFHPFRILSACLFMVVTHALALAGPGLIQYQGRLTDAAGNPVTTPVVVTFTFWSAASGGSQLGGYYDTDGVTPDAQGLYSTMIGDEPGTKIPDAIFSSPQVWLNVNVGGENLSPRKQIVAAGYAFRSNWATTATTALASQDTLDTVANRGASTSRQLTLGGGVRTGSISAPTAGGSVQVEDVALSDGSIKLPPIVSPSDVSGKLYQAGQMLYWYGIPVMLTRGTAYIYVSTTPDPGANGLNLRAAYAYAKTLKPYGKDLSTTNRLTVLVPPGRYDLTAGQLVLDTQFIDLVGVSTARHDQFLYAKMSTNGASVLRQTAGDVRIENLFLEGTCHSVLTTPTSVYYPDSGTTQTVIRNCEFSPVDQCVSMAFYVDYPGRYENCKSGRLSFGYQGRASGTYVHCETGNLSFGSHSYASGTFIECSAGNSSFGYHGTANGSFDRCTAGYYSFGYYGTASGTFRDCSATNSSFGSYGTASGTFQNCTAQDASFGAYGTASGTFLQCNAGNSSFGYSGTAGGKFINCTAKEYSFGSMGTAAGGVFTNCSGRNYCFGHAGTANGTYENCSAYSYSFGGGSETKAGVASGTFRNCKAIDSSFGSAQISTHPKCTCSGLFVNCIASNYSFGAVNSDNSGARLQGCRVNFTWSGTWAGRMDNCWFGSGVNCAATARIYGSTFVGTLNLNNTAAGATQSRCKALANYGNNVFGATPAAAMIIADGDVQ
ncbi:MAG: hypothetical protein ABFD69_11300 [Candidatus Sumerlaeia bacterium]